MIIKFIRVILVVLFSSTASVALADRDTKEDMFKLFEEYILTNPEIIEKAVLKLQEKRKNQDDERINSIIEQNIQMIENPETLYIGGNPDGDITIVEFMDYNCPYCKRSFKEIEALLGTDKNIKTVMYEFPILGPSSVLAARVSLAAKEQGKYWVLHKALMDQQGKLTEEIIFQHAEKVGLDIAKLKTDMNAEAIDIAIGNSMELARVLNINGTPAFIIEGKLYHGAVAIAPIVKQIRVDRAKTASDKSS